MKMSFSRILRISRPRFWIYIFGPYLLGACAALLAADTWSFSWQTLLFATYFLFSANLLIYGVNDIFDYETDRLNPKKQGYEELVRPEDRKPLWFAIAVSHIPCLPALVFLDSRALLMLAGFWFFSLGYSLPPLRAKARPFFDSFFNVLYVFPAFFSYVLGGGGALSWQVVFAAWCWVMAMHAFSAVPDISADTHAGVRTIATVLGKGRTIFLCGFLYALCAFFALPSLEWLAIYLGLAYVLLMIFAYFSSDIMRIYRLFPWVNTFAGFSLFLFFALQLVQRLG